MDKLSEMMYKTKNGLAVGVVVSNNDPLFLGRSKVRIPYLHKPKDMEGAISDENLPWIPKSMQSGRYIEVGSKVYIMWENNDKQTPVIVGCVYRPEECYNGISYDNGTIYGGGRYLSNRIYTRWDRYFRDYISESRKGDVIYNEHQDEKETIGFIDRIGNWIKMVSPVTKEANRNNSSPSLGKVISKIKGGITGIFFRCVGTAIIQMIERDGMSEIIQKASKGSISIKDDITLTVDGKCSIKLTETEIVMSNGSSSISLKGGNVVISNGGVSLSLSGSIFTVNGGKTDLNTQTNLNSPSGASGVESPSSTSPLDIDKEY